MPKIAVITAFANQAAAIALSIPAGSTQQEFDFSALATTDPDGHAPEPSHCWASGDVLQEIVDVFTANPGGAYVCLPAAGRGRPPEVVLAEHVPVLYPYLGT